MKFTDRLVRACSPRYRWANIIADIEAGQTDACTLALRQGLDGNDSKVRERINRLVEDRLSNRRPMGPR